MDINLPQWPVPQGWQCPACRAVMAPTQPYCVYCKPFKPGDVIRTGVPDGPASTTGHAPDKGEKL